jgi:hypothetical protein
LVFIGYFDIIIIESDSYTVALFDHLFSR